MKKSLIVFLMIAGTALMFNSCKKEYLVEAKGTASGNVKDYFGVNIKALVSIEGTSLKDSTDENGNYQIGGIPLGEHYLVVTKEGYSTYRTMISVYEENTAVANTTSGKKQSYSLYVIQDARLSPLTATLKGFVTFNGVPLANAKVYLYAEVYKSPYTYSYGIDNSNIFETTATTGADGSYSFTKLPFGAEADVIAYHPTNVNLSGSEEVNLGRYSVAGNIVVSNDPFLFVGSSITTGVPVDTAATVTLTFSENVSGALTLSKGGVELYRGNYPYGTQVGATVTFSGNTISVKPVGNFLRGSDYYVAFAAYASENKVVSNYIAFETVGRNVTLSGTPVITASATTLTVTTVLTGATGYLIYYKTPGNIDYAYLSTVYSPSTTYSISGYAAGTMFYVLPYAVKDGRTYYGTPSAAVTKP